MGVRNQPRFHQDSESFRAVERGGGKKLLASPSLWGVECRWQWRGLFSASRTLLGQNIKRTRIESHAPDNLRNIVQDPITRENPMRSRVSPGLGLWKPIQ